MQNIRNIGIIAHIDAGKTTLAERILFYTKEIHRMGEVDDGAATMDYLPEEQERGITIVASCSSCTWQGVQINLIDTPGHVDFTIEVERTLRVLDGAVCVICATRGVEPQSETVWRQSEKFFIPKIVFINKMDRLGADFNLAVDSLRSRLGANPVPVQMPVIENDAFCGVIDLISLERLDFDQADQGRTVMRSPLQGNLLVQALGCREQMLEQLADADEEFLELYLSQPANSLDNSPAKIVNNSNFDLASIKAAFARATQGQRLTPVFLGSALQNIGVQPVLDAVKDYLPSPEQAHLPVAMRLNSKPGLIKQAVEAGGQPAEKNAEKNIEQTAEQVAEQEALKLYSNPKGPLAALVFKVVLEAGHPLAYVRIYSGSLNKGDTCFNPGTGREEKINHLYRVHVDDKEAIQTALAGEVVALGGMHDLRTGHTLCHKDFPLLLEDILAYSPVISLALEPANSEEGKKMDEALKHYLLEDPTLKLEYDENTGQRVVSGMGELHLEVLLERMQREYHLSPRSGEPGVVFQETIRTNAQVQLKIDREIGDSLHQGEISLRVLPLARGSGNKLDFLDAREPTKALTSNPTPPKPQKNKSTPTAKNTAQLAKLEISQAVETALQGGPLGGYRVVDVQVEVLSYVHKQGAGLAMAALAAVKEALTSADPAYLEPIMSLEMQVPLEAMGDVLNLLGASNGRVIEVTGNEQTEIVRAEAAMKNLFGFATALRSASKGRAGLTLLFSRFDFWQ